MGWRLDLINKQINKLTPPAAAAQHVYYCGNRNALTRYDAAHSADILFILALNLLLWGGVAVLCATLEYNVKVNVCVSIAIVIIASVFICKIEIIIFFPIDRLGRILKQIGINYAPLDIPSASY